MWNIRPFILILVCFLNVECLLDETEVEINILRLETKYTGKKGTAVFLIESHPELNVIDTSKGTCFQSKLLLDTNPYVVKCGFFKAERDTLYMFCNLEDTIPSGNYTFDFNNIQPFTYKNYKVTIKDIFEELNNRVDYMIDGGETNIGLESTVIRVINDKIHILRPGKITYNDLKKYGEVIIDSHVLSNKKKMKK